MSAFNPKKHLTPEEWQIIAQDTIAESNAQYLIVGGIIGGGILASVTGFLPTGILFSCWAFYNAFKTTQLQNHNELAITEYGCVAHVLKGDDFYDFLSQVGHEEVCRQLNWASTREYKLSSEAQDYLECNPIQESQQIPEMKQVQSEYSQQTVFTPAIPQHSLNSKVIVDNSEPSNVFEVINHLSDKIQNCFIVGLPGSGKDFLVSHATRRIKNNQASTCLFLIDCKNDSKEHAYHEHFDYIERISDWSCDAWEYVTWFKKAWRCYEDVAKQCEREGRKCLVVINEGTRSGQCFSEESDPFIKGKLTAITSSGDSRGRNIWIMVQAPQLADLGFGDNVRSQLLVIAILHESNLGAVGNWWKTNILGKHLKQEQLLSLIGDSSRKRIVYSGKTMQWYPMPELQNFSGYDRDKGEFLPGFEHTITQGATAVQQKIVETQVINTTKTRELTAEEHRLIQLLDEIPAGIDALIDRFAVHNNERHKNIVINRILEVCPIANRLDLLQKFGL